MDIDSILNTDNWFNFSEFYDYIAKQNYKVLVEIGVWKGHSVSYLAQKIKDPDAQIWAVDLFDDTYYFETWEKISGQIPYIKDVYNKNLINAGVRYKIKDIKSMSWEAAQNFEDGSVDFAFIDADHGYESVVKDIDSWYPKIKSGGMLAGHDYPTWAGVKKAVDEFADSSGLKLNTFKGSVWYFNKPI